MTADTPTYYQVVHPFTFQHNNLTFSSTASSVGGGGTSTRASSSDAHVDPELTENATVIPESFTTRPFEGGNRILDLTPPTGWRIRTSLLTLIVTSNWWAILARTTMNRPTSGCAKNSCNWKYHSKTLGYHKVNCKHPQCVWKRAQQAQFTKGAFHPGWFPQTHGARGEGGNPYWNPPRQWWDETAPHPIALSISTPIRLHRRPKLTSIGYLRICKWQRSRRDNERPSWRETHGRQW